MSIKKIFENFLENLLYLIKIRSKYLYELLKEIIKNMLN